MFWFIHVKGYWFNSELKSSLGLYLYLNLYWRKSEENIQFQPQTGFKPAGLFLTCEIMLHLICLHCCLSSTIRKPDKIYLNNLAFNITNLTLTALTNCSFIYNTIPSIRQACVKCYHINTQKVFNGAFIHHVL